MRYQRENRHILLKLIVLALVVFLTTVAFMDFTPPQTPVEKVVSYTDKGTLK